MKHLQIFFLHGWRYKKKLLYVRRQWNWRSWWSSWSWESRRVVLHNNTSVCEYRMNSLHNHHQHGWRLRSSFSFSPLFLLLQFYSCLSGTCSTFDEDWQTRRNGMTMTAAKKELNYFRLLCIRWLNVEIVVWLLIHSLALDSSNVLSWCSFSCCNLGKWIFEDNDTCTLMRKKVSCLQLFSRHEFVFSSLLVVKIGYCLYNDIVDTLSIRLGKVPVVLFSRLDWSQTPFVACFCSTSVFSIFTF